MSLALPGVNGTTMRIGPVGYCCARQSVLSADANAAAASTRVQSLPCNFISPPAVLPYCCIAYDDIVLCADMMVATRQTDLSAAWPGGAFMKSFTTRVLFAVSVTMGIQSSSIAAEQSYPTHPLRIVVPFAPGGASDVVVRMLAQKLSDSMGQTVVVDN